MGKVCMAALSDPYGGGRAVYCGGVVFELLSFG